MTEPMNPYDSPESGKPGMSGTAKVLMVFGIGFVVLAVLCCGGVGFFGYWGYNLAKNAMSQDPETIRRVTDEIVTIAIPDAFEPQMSMDMKAPVRPGKHANGDLS